MISEKSDLEVENQILKEMIKEKSDSVEVKEIKEFAKEVKIKSKISQNYVKKLHFLEKKLWELKNENF